MNFFKAVWVYLIHKPTVKTSTVVDVSAHVGQDLLDVRHLRPSAPERRRATISEIREGVHE